MASSSWKWRGFDEFFDTMNQPPGDIAMDRITDNIAYFRLNYTISLSLTLFFTSIFEPNFLIIALPIITFVGCFFGFVYEQPIRIGDEYITVKLLSRIYAICSILLIIATSGSVFFIILLLNICLILLHAYLKERGTVRKVKGLVAGVKSNNNPVFDRLFEVLEICLGLEDSTEVYNRKSIPRAVAQNVKNTMKHTFNSLRDGLNSSTRDVFDDSSSAKPSPVSSDTTRHVLNEANNAAIDAANDHLQTSTTPPSSPTAASKSPKDKLKAFFKS